MQEKSSLPQIHRQRNNPSSSMNNQGNMVHKGKKMTSFQKSNPTSWMTDLNDREFKAEETQ